MRIAIVTFDGFDEIDAFVTLGLLNRLGAAGWRAEIASPATHVSSMNGVTVQAQRPLAFANEADAVILGSGLYARAIAEHGAVIDRLSLDPLRQSIGASSAGTLLLARLGLLADLPACTDAATRPWVVEAGVRVVDEPFHARGPIATAGGSLASPYLAAWLMARHAGFDAAAQALRPAAPGGDRDAWVAQLLAVVRPFVEGTV